MPTTPRSSRKTPLQHHEAPGLKQYDEKPLEVSTVASTSSMLVTAGSEEAMQAWMQSTRFRDIQRPYDASTVLKLRSPLCEVGGGNGGNSRVMSTKAWAMFQTMASEKTYSHTFGALDPVQVAQMAPSLSTVYVSGWQSSSTASTSNEPGPDLADYPYDTVPNKVDQLFRAQDFHACKQREARSRLTPTQAAVTPEVDYYRPIIADADTGHGGKSAVMRLTKLFIEAGAAGIHLEDQRAGSKKCGHMGGKCLVPVQEHCDRLIAARLQADMMGVPLVIVARTDAEAATLLDSDIDPRDQPFIKGVCDDKVPHFSHTLWQLKARGASAHEVETFTSEWNATTELMTYRECVNRAINDHAQFSDEEKAEKVKSWERAHDLNTIAKHGFSNESAREVARSLGVDPYWNCQRARTREGFFHVCGGTDFCIVRGIAFAMHADLLWMETKKPGLKQASRFVNGVRAGLSDGHAQRQLFAYNLSPSFNWDKAGMSDEEIGDFMDKLGELGFVWQFITLAGFHSDSLGITRFARDFAKRKMLAYVTSIQRQERDDNVATLTHQRWSGAEFVDTMLSAVTAGLSSTAAMKGESCTEGQFK